MRPDRKTFEMYVHDPPKKTSLNSSVITSLLIDKRGTLWVGTETGLNRFDPGTGEFRKLPKRSPAASIAGTKLVRHIYEDREGMLWLCTLNGGVLRFDPRSDTVVSFRPGNPPDTRLGSNIAFVATEDLKGRIWVAHLYGIDVIDPHVGIVQTFRHDPGDPFSPSGGRVYSVFRDHAGTMWFGAAGSGLNRYDAQRNRFGLYRGGRVRKPGEEDYQVFAILETRDGSVWLGSTEGLEVFDPTTATAKPAASVLKRISKTPSVDVLSLYQDRDGYLWVGYRDGRNLERINLQTGTIRRYPIPSGRSIYQDRDGEMWIGFWLDGVARLDAATGRYRIYRNDLSHPDSIHGGGAWAFFEDQEGRIWMGTWTAGGYLNLFDKTTGRFSRLAPGAGESEHRTAVNVRAIVKESDGTVWLGTYGNGLHHFNPHTNSFEYFYEQQGLPNNFIKGLLLDKSDHLWISTERGISRLDLRTRQFRNFTTNDGLQGDIFLSGSAFRAPDGTLYFGGEHGLNFFHPDSIRDDLTPPPVVITGFRIFDREQVPSFWRGTTIDLDYSQDFISFEFVGLDYTDPARNQYTYILDGFDRDWIEAGTRRYAAYTHLGGGSYTFRVRASNSDGVWNEAGASLRIQISPPFWERWWFILGAVLFIAAVVSMAFRIRLRQQLALERLRQRIASDLHDDVGTELSSIVLGSQYLARTLPLDTSDRMKIDNLGGIAQTTHEMMRDIVWVLRSDNDTLEELIVKMREVADRLLTGRTYVFHSPSVRGSRPLPLEMKRNLFLFYKEALNNIVRHSGATSVEISFTVLEKGLTLRIKDNGRGFGELQTASGTGLRNLSARADAMGAKVSIESDPGGGTVIRLQTHPT